MFLQERFASVFCQSGVFRPQTACASTCRGAPSAQEKAGLPFLCSGFFFCLPIRCRNFTCSFLPASSPCVSLRPNHQVPTSHKAIKNSSSRSPRSSRNYHRKGHQDPYLVLAFTAPSTSWDPSISCHFSNVFSWFWRKGYLSIVSRALYS